MKLLRNRWWGATLAVAVVATLGIVFGMGAWNSQPAEAGQTQTSGWALVNTVWDQVIAVYPEEFDRHDLYDNHPRLKIVKIPDTVTVEAHNTAYIDGEFVARPWGWWAAAPTPTPTAGGTGNVETIEPTAEPTATPVPSTPTPTATPDPDAVTLEDLQALVDQLQLQVIDLENRLATAEAEIATLKGP